MSIGIWTRVLTMKKLLFTFRHFHWNGQAGCILRLADELKEQGFDISFICGKNSEFEKRLRLKKYPITGFITFNCTRGTKKFELESKRLRKLLKKKGFDLIQTNGPTDMEMVAHAMGYKKGKQKVIRVIHSSNIIEPNEINIKIFSEFLDAIVVEYKKALKEVLGYMFETKKLDKNKIFVSHGTFDKKHLQNFYEIKPLQIKNEKKIIGFIGRLEKDKGIYYLIDAISKLSDRDDFTVWLLGTGSQADSLKQKVERLGLQRKVVFHGFKENIASFLSEVSFVVLPSIGCDASSTVVKEALFLKKPVIATRVGGIEEMISHRENGLLVPPGDSESLAKAIKLLLEKPEMLTLMKKKCKKHIAKFVPAHQAKILKKIYGRLI